MIKWRLTWFYSLQYWRIYSSLLGVDIVQKLTLLRRAERSKRSNIEHRMNYSPSPHFSYIMKNYDPLQQHIIIPRERKFQQQHDFSLNIFHVTIKIKFMFHQGNNLSFNNWFSDGASQHYKYMQAKTDQQLL